MPERTASPTDPFHQREVFFFGSPLPELVRKTSGRFRGTGQHDDTRCRAIETMYKAEKRLTFLLKGFLEIPLPETEQVRIVRFVLLHEHTGRLVHNQKMVVHVQDVQIRPVCLNRI